MSDKNPEQEIVLPKQEGFFSTEKLRRSARAGTHLPDPTMAPYGYDPKARFNHLFPALELPALFPPGRHHPDDHVSFGSPELPPHQLYLGDNLYVLRGLPSESIDLIYIDPPFFSNRTYTQIWGDDNEVRSFGDIFQDGMFSYLAWLNARLWEMKRVLKSTGSIYVHCDWHASHYIKCEMDKIFGYGNLRNEIVWCYRGGGVPENDFAKKHDLIFRYSKSDNYYFNVDAVRIPYSDDVMRSDPSRYDKSYRASGVYSGYVPNQKGKHPEDWWEIQPIMPSDKIERIGYPTQKPIELVQRIVDASCPPDGVVADFFMGGGTTGAVAMGMRIERERRTTKKRDGTTDEKEKRTIKLNGKPRRFIGTDVSRVAVSVTASRLIEIGEQLSGVTVTLRADPTLDLKSEVNKVSDIRVGYVGSYPMEKFRGIEHTEFVKFILGLYGAMPFTTKTEWLQGTANNKLVLSIGPGNPDERIGLSQVEGAVKETLRQYQKQFSEGEERILQIIGWSFDPAVDGWRRKTMEVLNKKDVPMQIEMVSLASESFRQKIFRNVGEANIDLKFNRLNQLLSFTSAPFAGHIVIRGQSGLKVKFELEGARTMGAGGRLINCQWDFDYNGERFSQREYALNRNGSSGNFTAVLEIEHEFPRAGTSTIAARVQDNLDGQATAVAEVTVAEGKCEVKSVTHKEA